LLEASDLSRLYGSFRLSGTFPTAIFDSPLEAGATGGFFRKLWLIYRYNFSDQDVMIFSLPLFLTGLVVRVKLLVSNKETWLKQRADWLFLTFTLIFLYLNWHEALNLHGFRLTVPITLALIYFGYWGARAILKENDQWGRRVFAGSFILFLYLYIVFILGIKGYGSVIANQGFTALLLQYKLPIFLIIFCLGFIFLWSHSRLNWPPKNLILVGGILILFIIKFLPFYLESKVALKTYGFNYGLLKSSPLLRELRSQNVRMATNINPYFMNYYAENLKLPNQGAFPKMRILREEYPQLYIWYGPTKSRPRLTGSWLLKNKIHYIFFADRTFSRQSVQEFEAAIKPLKPYLALIKEEHRPNSNRLQWQLLKFNFNLYLDDYLPLTE
jgi:hypothetical protein